MISRLVRRSPSLLIPAAVLLALGVLPAFGQGEDFTATVAFETSEGPNTMEIMAGPEHLRMNMSADRGNVSMVWSPASMLMIMHEQSMYMEFTQEMMERMRAMMGAMPGGAANMPETDEIDTSQYSFATTGATDEINGVAVFEVAMSGPDNQSARLWMSEAPEIGLFEVFSRMSSALQSLSMPGMSSMNPAAGMQDYLRLARAQGLPAGKVLRVVDEESGTQITLGEVALGAHDPSTWLAPDGYQKQSLPMMQR